MKKILCILVASLLLILASGCTAGSEELPSPKSGQIALFGDGAFIIDADNTLWTWGNNENGSLGLGSEFTKVLEPTKLMQDVVKVCIGQNTYFLKEDGVVLKLNTDNNTSGSFSHDPETTPIYNTTPTKVLEGAVDIAVSGSGGIALKSNGEVWGWGSYVYGVMPDEAKLDEVREPYLIMENAKQIRNDEGNFAVITENNDLYIWGMFGKERQYTPVKIMSNVKKVLLGPTNYVLKKDNSLWGFGSNAYGQLGNGKAAEDYKTMDEVYINKPIKITGGVKDFASCFSSLFFIKNDNSLWGCGSNDYGQLGNGAESYEVNRIEKKPIPIDKDVTKVYAGSKAVYYCKGGALWACGNNAEGQLGIGTDLVELMNSFNPMLSTPQKIIDGEVLDLYTYGSHIVCLMKDGSIKLWGADPLFFQNQSPSPSDISPVTHPELFTGSLGRLVNTSHCTPAPETLPLPKDFAPRTE